MDTATNIISGSVESAREAETSAAYMCPHCRGVVQLRTGHRRYFAHQWRKNEDCPLRKTGESTGAVTTGTHSSEVGQLKNIVDTILSKLDNSCHAEPVVPATGVRAKCIIACAGLGQWWRVTGAGGNVLRCLQLPEFRAQLGQIVDAIFKIGCLEDDWENIPYVIQNIVSKISWEHIVASDKELTQSRPYQTKISSIEKDSKNRHVIRFGTLNSHYFTADGVHGAIGCITYPPIYDGRIVFAGPLAERSSFSTEKTWVQHTVGPLAENSDDSPIVGESADMAIVSGTEILLSGQAMSLCQQHGSMHLYILPQLDE